MNGKAALLAPVFLALAAGAVIPFQAAANATVGRLLGHPVWAALVSLCVSLAVVIPALVVFKAPSPQIQSAVSGPWWLWIGGVMGALYVMAAAFVTPKLGAAGFLVCVVAGQLVVAVLVDHYGGMGLATKPINLWRIAGVGLILAGVYLVQGPGNPVAATAGNPAAPSAGSTASIPGR